MDNKPSSSKMPILGDENLPKKINAQLINIIDLSDDDDDDGHLDGGDIAPSDDNNNMILIGRNIRKSKIGNNENINPDDSMQKALEQWRSYGKRKLDKLDLQHEDDVDFYNFAATLLSSDEDSLSDFQKFINDNSHNTGDSYDDIDKDVFFLLDSIYFGRSQELKNLFSGVCVWVNGWTYPVAKTLHNLVHLTGGDYCLTYNPHKVTHIISTVISLSNLKSEKHQQNTVNPEWIIDSLKEQKILPLFDYRVVKPKNDIKKMFAKQFKKNRVNGPTGIDNSNNIEFVGSKTPTKSDSKSMDIMPNKLSDIDPDVLYSLPPEIIKELQEQMGNKQKTMKQSSSGISHPAVKLKQQTLIQTFGMKKSSSNAAGNKKHKAVIKIKDQPKIDALIKKQKDPDSKMVDLFSGKLDKKLGVNLCGISRPEEILSILEEWILDSTLNDQDCSYFIRFIANLIDSQKHDYLIEMLMNVRKFITKRSEIGGKEIDSWKDFFYDTLKEFLQSEAEFASKIPPHMFSRQ